MDKYLIFCEAKKAATSAVDLAVRTYETKLAKLSKSDPKLIYIYINNENRSSSFIKGIKD